MSSWGGERVAVHAPLDAQLVEVTKAALPKGTVAKQVAYFVIANDTNNAIKAVTKPLDLGIPVHMALEPLDSYGTGAFIISAGKNTRLMGQLAKEFALQIGAIDSINVTVKELCKPKVAAHTPGDATLVLRKLAFQVDYVSEPQIRAGVPDECDVLVNVSVKYSPPCRLRQEA